MVSNDHFLLISLFISLSYSPNDGRKKKLKIVSVYLTLEICLYWNVPNKRKMRHRERQNEMNVKYMKLSDLDFSWKKACAKRSSDSLCCFSFFFLLALLFLFLSFFSYIRPKENHLKIEEKKERKKFSFPHSVNASQILTVAKCLIKKMKLFSSFIWRRICFWRKWEELCKKQRKKGGKKRRERNFSNYIDLYLPKGSVERKNKRRRKIPQCSCGGTIFGKPQNTHNLFPLSQIWTAILLWVALIPALFIWNKGKNHLICCCRVVFLLSLSS